MEIPKKKKKKNLCDTLTAVLKKNPSLKCAIKKTHFLSKGFQSLFTNTHLHSPTSCWQDEETSFVDKKEYKDT